MNNFNPWLIAIVVSILVSPFFITQIAYGPMNSISHRIFYIGASVASLFIAASFYKIIRKLGNNYLVWGVIFGNVALICNLMFWAIAPGSEFKEWMIPIYYLAAVTYGLSHASHILDYYEGFKDLMLQKTIIVAFGVAISSIIGAWVLGWNPYRVL